MRCFCVAVALFCSIAIAASAHATSYTPGIDFRDAATWSDADHETSFTGTQSGVELTVTPTPSPATLWWDDEDGLGVRLSYEDDEIEAEENLRVVFHQGVVLSAIYISDLFHERRDGDRYYEKGSYRINGGAWVDFDAQSLPGSNHNGEHLISFGAPLDDVRFVDFRAPGKITGGEDHEFALMGFDATPVPEPGTALLLGLGLLTLGARARG